MNRFSRSIILSATLLLVAPHFVFAQTAAQVTQRFNPSANLTNSGKTFSGLSFSGVGGAVAGCTNLGGTISGGISSIGNIFKNKTPTTANTPNPSSLGNANAIAQSQASGASSPALTIPGTRDLSKPSIGISDTSNSISSAIGATNNQQVPVIAKKTDEELKKANQREQCLNGVAYAVAKGLLRQVTDKTLNWVNTGFNGNPLYVRDLNSFLRTVSDQRVSQFLNQIPSADPVFGNAIRSIATEQISGIQDGLIGSVMNTPEARAYQSFQEDFTNGGWQAFLNPQNNAVGAIFEAADDLSTDISAEEEKVKTQLQNGNGFLDLQRCVEYADESPNKYPYTYKSYSCQKDVKKDADAYYATCLASAGDPRNSATAQATCRRVTDQQFQSVILLQCVPTLQATAKKNDQRQCLRYETVTPGSIIQAQVATVTTSPTRQLEQADQINEVLGSFFDQLLNRLLSDGLSSLRGRSSSNYSFGGVGTNIVVGTSGTALSSAQNGASALGYQQSGSGFNDEFDISRPQHLRAVLQTQYDYLSSMLDARASLNRIVPTLGALDYCIPGPNPTWRDGLQENANNFLGSLQEVQKNSSGAGGTIGGAVGAIGGSFIPGIGTAIGGAIGSLLGGLFGDGSSHAIISTGITITDKVTGVDFPTRTVIFKARNRSIEYITNSTQWRLEELIKVYDQQFTADAVRNAFLSVDSGNGPYVQGFVTTSFDETSRLPAYSAAAFEIDAYYETSENEAREANAKLEAIRAEANTIVATAKARHIAAQAAAGTPVNLSCINEAYKVDTTPIVGRARLESSAPSPLFDRFIEANNYFYNNL